MREHSGGFPADLFLLGLGRQREHFAGEPRARCETILLGRNL